MDWPQDFVWHSNCLQRLTFFFFFQCLKPLLVQQLISSFTIFFPHFCFFREGQPHPSTLNFLWSAASEIVIQLSLVVWQRPLHLQVGPSPTKSLHQACLMRTLRETKGYEFSFRSNKSQTHLKYPIILEVLPFPSNGGGGKPKWLHSWSLVTSYFLKIYIKPAPFKPKSFQPCKNYIF